MRFDDRWDLSLEKKTLKTDKTFVREEKQYSIRPTTKPGESGERIISIDDYTIERLSEWLKIRAEIVMKFKKRPKFLFINQMGEHIKMANYGSALETLPKA